MAGGAIWGALVADADSIICSLSALVSENWMGGWVDGWVGGWVGGWMGEWVDG